MNKKGFSLIEIIFSLVLISIIATLAMIKFDSSVKNTNQSKIKSDVLQIRVGINNHKNSLILKNELDSFVSLNSSSDTLFDIVLDSPIPVSSTNSSTSWHFLGENQYKVFINSSEFIVFTFDSDTYTFQCSPSEVLCSELHI